MEKLMFALSALLLWGIVSVFVSLFIGAFIQKGKGKW